MFSWLYGASISFNAFDSDRYVLTYANETLREAAAHAPYDALILLFDSRKYGGGGIFNLWATCAIAITIKMHLGSNQGNLQCTELINPCIVLQQVNCRDMHAELAEVDDEG